MYRKSVEICLITLGDQDLTTAKSIEGLIWACIFGGNYVKSCELGQTFLELNLKLYGKNSPRTVNAMAALARCFFDADRFDECIKQ